MKLKRTIRLERETHFNCEHPFDYTTMRMGYIIMTANELAEKYNVEITDFGESTWTMAGAYIITKANKKDYKAFAQALILKLGDHLTSYKI